MTRSDIEDLKNEALEAAADLRERGLIVAAEQAEQVAKDCDTLMIRTFEQDAKR